MRSISARADLETALVKITKIKVMGNAALTHPTVFYKFLQEAFDKWAA
jgi:hypothetical protein